MTDHVSDARKLLAEALDVEVDEVAADASMQTLDSWTSLGHMRLMLALEETVGRELDPVVIVEIVTVTDIAAILEQRQQA
ncbi:MAG: acyl carrier protein [Alphaproteobacteria bacterium]|nr:acyl carrier protein [Alphaproteobacteria bacterium]